MGRLAGVGSMVRGAWRATGWWCVGGAAAAVATSVGLSLQADARLGAQRERNDYLRREVEKLDREIDEVRGLGGAGAREQVAAIAASRTLVGALGRERLWASRLLEALASLPPESSFLTGVVQEGARVRIEGRAARHEDVLELLQRLAASPLLQDPRILQVRIDEGERVSASFPVVFSVSAVARSERMQAAPGGRP